MQRSDAVQIVPATIQTTPATGNRLLQRTTLVTRGGHCVAKMHIRS
jgi:hypothetical protein